MLRIAAVGLLAIAALTSQAISTSAGTLPPVPHTAGNFNERAILDTSQVEVGH